MARSHSVRAVNDMERLMSVRFLKRFYFGIWVLSGVILCLGMLDAFDIYEYSIFGIQAWSILAPVCILLLTSHAWLGARIEKSREDDS